MSPQALNPEEVFEDKYTGIFRSRFADLGLVVKYERDRVGKDIGFHLAAAGSLELSNVRIWFQLKGIHAETLSAAKLGDMESVPIELAVKHVERWYASPEAVYVVVYLEALDAFIGEDIRDLVDRRFADHRGSVSSKMAELFQKEVTLHIPVEAIIDKGRIETMLSHRSMRIDGPSWRGKPLGHSFDPLRCELAPMDSGVFVELVEALLAAHDFRIAQRLDAASLIEGADEGVHEAYLVLGTMYSTFEWLFPLSVEFGVDPESELRDEGQTFSVQGRTAVLVHAAFTDQVHPASTFDETLDRLRIDGVSKILVMGNAPEALLLGWYGPLFGDLCDSPQGGGSLAYSVLTSPVIFLEFQERLTWNFVNYRWDDPDRPPVRLRS